MDSFAERSIKRCRDCITQVQEVCGRLDESLATAERLVGLDLSACHRVSSEILGAHATKIVSTAKTARDEISKCGGMTFLHVGEIRAQVELMRQLAVRIGDVLSSMTKAGGNLRGSWEPALEDARAAADKTQTACQALSKQLEPTWAFASLEMNETVDRLDAVCEGARTSVALHQRFDEYAPNFEENKVLSEPQVKEDIKKLAGTAITEACLAKTAPALFGTKYAICIVSVVSREVKEATKRAETLVEQMTCARADGVRLLQAVSQTREALPRISSGAYQQLKDKAAAFVTGFPVKALVQIDDLTSNLLELVLTVFSDDTDCLPSLKDRLEKQEQLMANFVFPEDQPRTDGTSWRRPASPAKQVYRPGTPTGTSPMLRKTARGSSLPSPPRAGQQHPSLGSRGTQRSNTATSPASPLRTGQQQPSLGSRGAQLRVTATPNVSA